MDARHLTPSQAEKMYVKLRPAFEYLAALQTRMDERQWERGDRLYLEIKAARDTMQLLCGDLHAIATRAYAPGGPKKD